MGFAAGELPGYTATLLGPERAVLSRALRQRMIAGGLGWPDWIDARPGLVQVLIGDCSDPPLGGSAAAWAALHGELLLDGIAALALVTAAPRMVLSASAPDTLAALRALCAGRPVQVARTAAAWPACPELDVEGARGRAYTIAAAQLGRIGALVREVAAPRLCTLAGALKHPQVLALSDGPQPTDEDTPEALVRRCGGATAPAWVAIADGPLGGVLWPRQQPLPAATALCLILPAAHTLVTRLRRGERWQLRARNACLSCRACTDFCPSARAGAPLTPHLLMRRLADAALPPTVDEAAACTGCGTCSLVCPAELLPGAALRTLAQVGGAFTDPRLPPLPSVEHRLPMELVLARLGLATYAAPVGAP
jgi:ferredoxin